MWFSGYLCDLGFLTQPGIPAIGLDLRLHMHQCPDLFLDRFIPDHASLVPRSSRKLSVNKFTYLGGSQQSTSIWADALKFTSYLRSQCNKY